MEIRVLARQGKGVRAIARELDALAIIETRFTAPEDTGFEDWKRIARERALMMLGRARCTAS